MVNINQGRNKVRPKEAAECHCAPIVSGMLIDARMRIKHPSGSRQRGMQAHPGYPWLASPRHNLVPGAVQEKQDPWFVHLAWTQHSVGSARGRIANSATCGGRAATMAQSGKVDSNQLRYWGLPPPLKPYELDKRSGSNITVSPMF